MSQWVNGFVHDTTIKENRDFEMNKTKIKKNAQECRRHIATY